MPRPVSLIQISLREAIPMMKALSNENRCRILEAVAVEPLTINELARELGLDQATISLHVTALEQVGLLKSRLIAAQRGQSKEVRPAVDNILLHLPAGNEPKEEEHVVDMPIGLYTSIQVSPTCGFASADEMINPVDTPSIFHHPKRTEAELIWMADGYLEYAFPYSVSPNYHPRLLEISAELCAEVYEYNEEAPTEITLWVNGVDVGTVWLQGDMGARYGRLTPHWVPETHTKYGFLCKWIITDEGSTINGAQGTTHTLEELDLKAEEPIQVRFGFKEDSIHGGMNICGSRFGDHEQAVRMRLVAAPGPMSVEHMVAAMRGSLLSAKQD